MKVFEHDRTFGRSFLSALELIELKRPLYKRITGLLNRYYVVDRAWHYLRFWLSHRRGRHPIVVYQMGKVGSSSIVASLSDRCGHPNVFHVHTLTPERIAETERRYRAASKIRGPGIDEHLIASLYLRRRWERRRPSERWKIVSLVRDPVARNVSGFFQVFDLDFPEIALRYERDGTNPRERMDELIDLFLHRFERHDEPLHWFDLNLKPVFGIDVFDEAFPKTQGYAIYQGEQADLLVLRTEDLNRCGSEALGEFLGSERLPMVDANLSQEKGYSEAYGAFKKTIALPPSYLDRIYSSRLVQHFYTPEEVDQFRRDWGGRK